MMDEFSDTILIVDDSPEILTVLGNLLAPHHDVVVANSGQRALDLMAEHGKLPSLVMLDIMMPEMDGYMVFERIRSDDVTAKVPVIFLTAMDSMDDEEKALSMGAVDYITKPIRATSVLARVRTQLELKRARDILEDKNAFLETEVERRIQDSEMLQEVTVKTLTQLSCTKDNETGSHIKRTQKYVETLANELKSHPKFIKALNGKDLDYIVRGAPLHDLGKVGIPDGILFKPGPLSREEWMVMRTHAKRGADLLQKALEAVPNSYRFLEVASEIARWHHEKWDGSGYPDGLKGEEIPVSARLMALSDVFDALITSRPYKHALSPEVAKAMIEKQRGLHFDPDVVDAFVKCFDTFVELAHAIPDEEKDT